MKKILVNAIKCKLCGEIIESTEQHQYVSCKCGACAVDGGLAYLRRSFKSEDCYFELSVTEEDL
jgi:phage FluMu protein Com